MHDPEGVAAMKAYTGGGHEPINVQLAHFECNWKRGATGFAQLRLLA